MNIKIICIGKLKEKYLKDAMAEYIKRLASYCKLEIVELKESKTDDIVEEGINIISKIKPNDYVITLEIGGKMLSSEDFSKKIENLGIDGHNDICFIIGGSMGLSEEVRQKSNFALSFSKMTFTHQMMRTILLEQVYRAFKIIKNEPYHK